MKQLKPQDAQFLYMETENNLSNATMLCIYEQPGNTNFDPVEVISQQLDSQLHLSTIFTHHIKQLPGNLDYPYWVIDPYFQLKNHIFSVTAPSPGDWHSLTKIYADIHSTALDLRRPPWEIHVVTGLKDLPDSPGTCFALVIKIHHAAIDGTAAMRFFQALHNSSKTVKKATQNPAEALQYEAPGRRTLLGNAAKNIALSPVKTLSKLLLQAKAAAESREAKLSNDKTSKSPVPSTRFNQSVGAQKTFSGVRFPLADLKSIRGLANGATLNDVILAICSGALHHYLDKHGELPNTPLAAWVPINARSKDASDIEGNNISAMAIKIASQINDPIERLQKICYATYDAKSGRSGRTARIVTDLTQHMPAAGMAVMTRLILGSSMTSKMCNLAISNVPGPNFPLFMHGAKCQQQYGMVPLSDGMGLFIVAMSYDGYMSLSVTSTATILPDIDFFTECLQQEFDSLLGKIPGTSSKQGAVKKNTPKKPAAKKASAVRAVDSSVKE
ncbi:acyltransferase, WS/DGAT/MGAT [Spongiibacter sp. IMCC21906]|uniref:wax ester/triacylglycerol synthase family O-acyltransferase n=1 Tax=Spongiibacter sp. IMCC21906 TaxID=1620392 RepID=UPI00062DDB65|nr:wax ester/triacylglycerol synthase family O-acyltransferase [Spongiibacter sp. IMCC21906]AKH69069.1 acyltransferase, WS/DGAT/MGAT [Spongiibacter sp. IMCC21906]